MQMTVDPSELLLRLEQAGRAPAQQHLTAAPTLHVARVVSADLDHRLDGVGRSQGACQGRWHAETGHGEGLGESLPQGGGSTGCDRSMRLARAVSYTHLRAHETRHDLVCRLLLE